ncbi:MAG: antitoxin component YwqK of YwqJK toxin-antitoxin module [Candidatus Latescibacterota bacterium]|jgi:uncharacterized protein
MKRVVIALLAWVMVVGCQRFEGSVQIKYQGRVVADGQYDNGMRTGTWTYYDDLGEIKGQGTYQNGQMQNGLEVVYHDNGHKQAEGTRTNGHKDGYWIEYYRSGAKQAEGTYLHGKKTGLWKEFDPSSFYITEKLYENDKLVGWREFKRGRLGNPLNG